MIEHVSVSLARPELISIHKVQQCHGLAPQCVDDVPIVDHVAVFALQTGPAAYQRKHARAADEQLHPIIEEARSRTVADQPRWHGVEDFSQDKAARSTHIYQLLLVVGGAIVR